jgi:hypothetical protein
MRQERVGMDEAAGAAGKAKRQERGDKNEAGANG